MLAFKASEHKLFNPLLAKRIIFCLVFVLVFDFFLFPSVTFASENNDPADVVGQVLGVEEDIFMVENSLPEATARDVVSTGYFTLTAYNSEVSQCDGNPCITANGFNLCKHGTEDSVAANFLPFGTKIRIPDLFGDRVFVVRDRMNEKYQNRIDVWMIDKGEAKQFGVKVAKIEILEH